MTNHYTSVRTLEKLGNDVGSPDKIELSTCISFGKFFIISIKKSPTNTSGHYIDTERS